MQAEFNMQLRIWLQHLVTALSPQIMRATVSATDSVAALVRAMPSSSGMAAMMYFRRQPPAIARR